LTTTGHSHIWEVSRGAVTEHDLNPVELGIPLVSLDELIGGDPEHNATIARAVFAGETGPVRDIVVLNAAAGLVAYDLAQNHDEFRRPITERLRARMATAAEVIDSGAAEATLAEWVAAANR